MWPFKKQSEIEAEAARRVAAVEKPLPSLDNWNEGREDTQVVATAVRECHDSIRREVTRLTRSTKSLREIASIPLQPRRT